jgi:hypothetical protein
MVSFQTKNANLGKFWRALDWKMLIYIMAIWNILQTFGVFYDHLVHFFLFWYHVPRKIWQSWLKLTTFLAEPILRSRVTTPFEVKIYNAIT